MVVRNETDLPENGVTDEVFTVKESAGFTASGTDVFHLPPALSLSSSWSVTLPTAVGVYDTLVPFTVRPFGSIHSKEYGGAPPAPDAERTAGEPTSTV
jgi:hypothetical protein